MHMIGPDNQDIGSILANPFLSLKRYGRSFTYWLRLATDHFSEFGRCQRAKKAIPQMAGAVL